MIKSLKPFDSINRMTEQDDVIIHFWQDVVNRALQTRASDIHVEPENGVSHIRLRVDGRLKKLTSSPSNWHERIVSRIKILARLDIAEKRLPQDGQMLIGYQANTPTIDCRISTLPTLHGEKIVLRILNKSDDDLNLNMLGFTDKQLSDLKHALSCQQGFILVTGPTGSGKTHTLYSCLKQLMDGTKNLTSIEDPIEVQLKGVNQVHVNEKAGLRFDTALRALMRQDPDVIMVGEIRDLETANIAVQAAQTGHLVLSTLHTNDAPSTLVRLRNMGTATYNIAASVTLITAQRLVRCLCPHCKQKTTLPRETWLQAGLPAALLPVGTIEVYTPLGCAQCHKGFAGRTGIFQVMPMSAALQALVLGDASTPALAAQAAREGVASLRVAGLRKVLKGITSLEEVLAATREDDGEVT